MSLRLNINNPEDKKLLAVTKNRITGKTLLEEHLIANKKQAAKELKGLSEEPQKKNKFGARSFYDKDGHYWHSEYEFNCYQELLILEKVGKIRNLETQVVYKFEHNEIYITKIIPDFRFEFKDKKLDKWQLIIADAKSIYISKKFKFVIQKKLLKAFYGIDILLFIKDKKEPVYNFILEFTNSR